MGEQTSSPSQNVTSEDRDTRTKIRVGISACLLGHQVRFDGSHKRDRFLTDTLGEHVRWVSVCPEVGSGMSTPRPTLRLVRSPESAPGQEAGEPRLITGKTGEDWTERMEAYGREVCGQLRGSQLCGFILKSKSPSCGMERVRVYDHNNVPQKDGVGVFARILREHFPRLPVEEEGRLKDPALREAFLDAVFAYARWQAAWSSAVSPTRLPAHLIDFHRRNKYQLRAHSPSHCTELGRIVARSGEQRDGQLVGDYGSMFMEAMNVRPTPGRHAETMRCMTGRLKRYISPSAHQLLHESIDDYRDGIAPRSVPIALLRNHARERQLSYLVEQSYLDPYPKTLRRAGR